MTPFFRQPVLGVLLLGIAASSAAAQSFLQQYGEIVQGPGEAVTPMPGVTWDTGSLSSSVPSMDLNGNMVWRAKLAGAVTTGVDDYAVFYGRTKDDLQVILRRGAAEPSGTLSGVTATYSATGWDGVRISAESNFMLLLTTLAGTGVTTTNDTCLYWGLVGNPLQILAREGDTAPTGGATFTGNISGAQSVTGLNSVGTAVFKVKLAGGDVGSPNGASTWGDDALLTGSPGGLSWVARDGQIVNDPVTSTNPVIDNVTGTNVTMDEDGHILWEQGLSMSLGSTPATTVNDQGIILYTPSSGLSFVAREGWDLPGYVGTLTYGTFSASAFSRQSLSRTGGKIVLTTNAAGAGVSSSNDVCILGGSLTGGLTVVAREADPAPTGVPGEVYQAIFTSGQPAINNNGTIVFVAQLGPPAAMTLYNDVAVFRAVPPYGPGDVTMIVREGDTVAGTAGWKVSNTSGGGMSSSATRVAINERESILISVAGVGDDTQVNWGVPAVLAWDPDHASVTPGSLTTRAVYVQGDSFTVNGGPWATTAAAGAGWISTMGSSSGDGSDLGFNNNGDICFKLFNGSQNAIARIHTGSMISEPASVPVAGGVPHNFHIDCGPTQAGQFYLVLATGLGTRPGFTSPFGGQTVCLNPDPLWTDLSLNNPNSIVWPNTLGVLDVNGKNTLPASFLMPPGFPGFLGTTLHHAVVAFDLSVPPLQTTYASEPSGVHLY